MMTSEANWYYPLCFRSLRRVARTPFHTDAEDVQAGTNLARVPRHDLGLSGLAPRCQLHLPAHQRCAILGFRERSDSEVWGQNPVDRVSKPDGPRWDLGLVGFSPTRLSKTIDSTVPETLNPRPEGVWRPLPYRSRALLPCETYLTERIRLVLSGSGLRDGENEGWQALEIEFAQNQNLLQFYSILYIQNLEVSRVDSRGEGVAELHLTG